MLIWGYRAAAAFVKVTPITVKRWRAAGLPCVKQPGGMVGFQPEHLLAWRRYKLLVNPSAQQRRRALEAVGLVRKLTEQEKQEIFGAFAAAGGSAPNHREET